MMGMKGPGSPGGGGGRVPRGRTCHSDPPSVRAASRTSRGMDARPAPMTTIAKPAQIQMYAMMSEGVMSFGPSQPKPPNGFANVDAPIAVVYVPAGRVQKSKGAASFRVRDQN